MNQPDVREMEAPETGDVVSLARSLSMTSIALNRIKQGLCMFDGDQRLLLFNDRYAEMYGIDPSQLFVGITLREIVRLRYAMGHGPKMSQEQYASWRDQVGVSGRVVESIVELSTGAIHEIHHTPLPCGGWVATFEDITARRRDEEAIRHMAHHDALTGLPNRVLFTDRLNQAAERLTRQDAVIGLLCLDLDRFKEVNDTLGHSAGDILLQQVVGRIRGHVRASDTFARLGGDEFAILLSDLRGPEVAATLASRIVCAIAPPFLIEQNEVLIGVSIGIALASGTTGRTPPQDLLRSADMALYRVKEEGRGTFRFFDADMNLRLQHRKTMERDLRRALAEHQFELHMQPQFDILTQQISGAEALLRWRHPVLGMVPPVEFIPIAEDTGLIVPIGIWVLRAACEAAAAWGRLRLSVNLSPIQIRDPTLPATVFAILDETGFPADRLELEITEGTLLQETTSNLSTLEELRRAGIAIALDDFGTGYSSLAYLRRFPFDKLKIDRGFIATMAEDAGAAAIVQAVIALGRSLGMRVNAEGIETSEQLRLLQLAGCDEAQGYLLGRPMPIAELNALYASDMGAVP